MACNYDCPECGRKISIGLLEDREMACIPCLVKHYDKSKSTIAELELAFELVCTRYDSVESYWKDMAKAKLKDTPNGH